MVKNSEIAVEDKMKMKQLCVNYLNIFYDLNSLNSDVARVCPCMVCSPLHMNLYSLVYRSDTGRRSILRMEEEAAADALRLSHLSQRST